MCVEVLQTDKIAQVSLLARRDTFIGKDNRVLDTLINFQPVKRFEKRSYGPDKLMM